MERVVLTGPMHAGKSAIAQELEKLGYLRIQFNDILKEEAVVMLGSRGIRTTVEEMNQNKAFYRRFLQELAVVIGFNYKHDYVARALHKWREYVPVVVDNIRSDAQAMHFKKYGFSVVRVAIGHEEQVARAFKLGVSGPELADMLKHPIEEDISYSLVDYTVDGTVPPTRNARAISVYGDARQPDYAYLQTLRAHTESA